MYYALFVQLLTYLSCFLSDGLKGHNLFDIGDFARVALSRPPPPPPVFFPTSADFADEFHLWSLVNVTATPPPSPCFLFDGNDFPSNTDSSFFLVSSLPRLLTGILDAVVQISSWIAFVAVGIAGVALQALALIGTPATVAYILREQGRRDLANLEVISSGYVDAFWEEIGLANNLEAYVQTLQMGQDAYVQTLREEQDAVVQTLRTGQDAIVLDYQGQITALEGERQKAAEEADQCFAAAQDKNNRRIDELEKALEEAQAGRQEARQEVEKRDADLAQARQMIESLQTSIRSNSQELLMYRDRARAQRQVGYQSHPPPPPPQTPMAPFAPYQPPYNGMPPNRTGGFMGNMPPPGWGRGRQM